MGFALPDDRAHGTDERFSLAMLARAIATSAAFLDEVAR
jgi:acetylornithine deacetylase/succinyl-diaminopimelate desuccinylase-like protein